MSEVSVKSLGEIDSMSHEGMTMTRIREGLGISSFGINVIDLPAGNEAYPEHDHAAEGLGGEMFGERSPDQLAQEEIYTVLEGSAMLQAGDESWDLAPGVFARVGPGQVRKILPGPEGCRLLALGATPGAPYGDATG